MLAIDDWSYWRHFSPFLCVVGRCIVSKYRMRTVYSLDNINSKARSRSFIRCGQKFSTCVYSDRDI